MNDVGEETESISIDPPRKGKNLLSPERKPRLGPEDPTPRTLELVQHGSGGGSDNEGLSHLQLD